MPFDNPPEPNRYAILLRRAKTRIQDEDRWTRGRYHTPEYQECVVQAVMTVCGRGNHKGAASGDEIQLYRLLAAELPSIYRFLPMRPRAKLIMFNDWGHRRHSDIVDLMDRAITRAELV